MKRLRILLLLVALGLALPASLLVRRALTSLELENAVRHEAVAERVFDEMERSLSQFLEREEGRAADDYLRPGDEVFVGADEPFVVGWFELDANGAVQAVRLGALAGKGGSADRVERAVSAVWRAPIEAADAETEDAALPASPAPGETAALGKQDVLRQKKEASTGSRESNAYEVLQSLNRASQLRADERNQKLAAGSPEARSPGFGTSTSGFERKLEVEAAEMLAQVDLEGAEAARVAQKPGPAAESERDGAPELPASADAPSRSLGRLAYRAAEPDRDAAATGVHTPSRRLAAAPDAQSSAQPAHDPGTGAALLEEVAREPALARAGGAAIVADAIAGRSARAPLARSVDPMVGRITDEAHLVLIRAVWAGERGRRQGLVLDRVALAAWLEHGVLSGTGLDARARLRFLPTAPEARSAQEDAGFVYLHRFGEPFDGLIARLALEPLPGLASPRPIWALAALLAGITALGLFAVHRMTSVVVEFAQRRSDFVAAVSHELKTPLTSIRMYGEMLRDGLVRDEDKRDEYYATIADESERLSRLIHNVLEFSRLEQDRGELQLVVGSLGEALCKAAEKLRAYVEREGFQLRVEVEEGLPAVRFDRDAVTQLVFNLVDNAIKYAGASSRREIVLEVRAAGGGIELSVRDYGPGVSARQLRRVFEPFYRGQDELTRNAKGTGIGLALVKEIGEAMGATVSASNPSGGGFCVCLAFSPARAA